MRVKPVSAYSPPMTQYCDIRMLPLALVAILVQKRPQQNPAPRLRLAAAPGDQRRGVVPERQAISRDAAHAGGILDAGEMPRRGIDQPLLGHGAADEGHMQVDIPGARFRFLGMMIVMGPGVVARAIAEQLNAVAPGKTPPGKALGKAMETA